MPEYIEREKAIEHIETHLPYRCSEDFVMGQQDCIEQLKSLPTADVVEVVHGEWIRGMGSYTRIKCSKCEWTKPYIEDFYEAELLADMSYCPNCGARMDGDKNG
jgi:hypothetical protein